MLYNLSIEMNLAEKNKIQYSKHIEGTGVVKSEVQEIKNMIDTEIKDSDLNTTKIESLYMKMAGSIYTLLSTESNKKLDESR